MENYGIPLLFMELGHENSGEEISLTYAGLKRKEKGTILMRRCGIIHFI